MITTVKLGGPIQSSPPFLFFGLGSCFVQNLAAPLDKINIPYLFNPLGTSFNPISIARQLEWLLDPKATFNPAYFHSGVYHQLDAVNKFQNINEAALNESIENIRRDTLNHLKSTVNPALIISFGTAYSWEINDAVVNNCHKLPQHLFQRRILTIEEIESAWDTVLKLIPEDWKIIFTVSPVKYTKLGLEENFISKSILRLTIKSFIENYSNSYYFPSFEIITDELRDYSFYKENGTHPNETAVEVVFNRFRSFLNF